MNSIINAQPKEIGKQKIQFFHFGKADIDF